MCFKTFRELSNKIDRTLIPPKKFYSGHQRTKDGKKEYLEEHCDLALEYFLYLVEKNSLEPIFDRNITFLFGKDSLEEFKKILILSIYYHDIGKINKNFQKKVLGKYSDGDSGHSYYSKRILEIILLKMFPQNRNMIYLILEMVKKHHTRLGDYSDKQEEESKEQKRILKEIFREISFDSVGVGNFPKPDIFEILEDDKWKRLFFLLKLIYSLLVMSDAYSTFHFSEGLVEKYPVNCLNEESIEKMEQSFGVVPYNNIRNPDKIENINDMRAEMLWDADRRMKKLLDEADQRIFMLPIPTGGGKTNISMRLSLNILKARKDLKRIFYVFPYINIIEQNYQVIEETLFNSTKFKNKSGLISDIYSKSYVDKEIRSEDEEKNADTLRKMLIIDDSFLNNAVNVITSVNFFNSFIKTGGNNRYKLANLANSIVIIDEVQTFSDKNIRLFYDFISEASESLNIYFILMSATLPDMNYFLDVNVPSLIENPEKYFTDRIFKRNQIILRKNIETLEGVEELILKEIEKTSESGIKILITLNTVATSRRMFEKVLENDRFKDFEIFLLNSTLSSPRRRKIIEEIKNENGKNKIIVSTQSIEAGVDIDCNIGIRDFAIIDSIEQIAGRINREAKKEKAKTSKLYVVHIKRNDKWESDMIYGGSSRYKIITNQFKPNEIENILNKKRFDEYYHSLAEEVKKPAKDIYDKIGRAIMDLHYKEVNNSVDVIEEKVKKIDIFLCSDLIPIDEISEYDIKKIKSIFEDPELKSLHDKYPVLMENGVNTKNLFQIWEEVFKSTDKFDAIFLRRKITSALNQFAISLNNMNKKGSNLEDYLMMKGFIVADENFDILRSTERFLEFYSFRNGLDVEKLRDALNSDVGVIL